MVDSGADGTLLPGSAAGALGLNDADLVPVLGGSGGAGGTSFPIWESKHPLTGQIVQVPPNGSPKLWGPVIAFEPVFADGEHALYGRKDFFARVTITFGEHPTLGSVFHVDC